MWLCTDAAANINGRTFHVGGDEVSLLSEPTPERTVTRSGGWDLDSLDASGLGADLTNPFTLDSFPELKHFDG